jgi:hypothetical protein
VTVLAFCWFYLWEDEPVEEEALAEAGAQEAAPPTDEPPLPDEPVGTGQALPSMPIEAPPPMDEGSEAVPDAGVLTMTPERQAADALMAGRLAEAATMYDALARVHAGDTTYAEIARILRRRLQARCVDGVDPEGRPCE